MIRCTRRWSMCFGFVLLLAPGTVPGARGSGEVRYQPAPAWVERLDVQAVDTIPTNQVSGGIYYLMVDHQYHYGEDPRVSFHDIAEQILNEHGAQACTEIRLHFDPSYQDLVIHEVAILRDGVRMNRLEPGQVQVIQRETDLDRRLYDGRLTALLFLEDVRAGDVLHYAFSQIGSNPLFGEAISLTVHSQFSSALAEYRLGLWMPPELPTTLFTREHVPDLVQGESGGWRTYTFHQQNLPPVRTEDDTPPWTYAQPDIQCSSYTGWGDAAAGLIPLYEDAMAELDPDTAKRVAHWKTLDPEDALVQAIRHVQDDIRYLGMELGENAYRPSPASVSARRRFGDCKDKSVLLCAIARALDVEAHPALVASRLRGTVGDYLPAPLLFDHCIARLRWQERDIWIDPTDSLQGGPLEQRWIDPFEWALVLAEGVTALSPIDSRHQNRFAESTHETFLIHAEEDSAELVVRSEYSGGAADDMRTRLATNSREEVQQRYTDFYRESFPEVNVQKPLIVEDDREANVVNVMESYRVSPFWEIEEDDGTPYRYFRPHGVDGYVQTPGARHRLAPLALDYPLQAKHRVEVQFPDPDEWFFEPEFYEEQGPFMHTLHRVRFDEGTLNLTWEVSSLTNLVPAAAMESYYAGLEKVEETFDNFGIQDASSETSESSFNWILAILDMMAFLLAGMALAWHSAHQRHKYTGPPPLVNADAHRAGLCGIGGWLTLPAIGIALNAVVMPGMLIMILLDMDLATWHDLTRSSGDPAQVLMLVHTLLEHLGYAVLTSASLFLAVHFFRRRRCVPAFYITLVLSSLVLEGILAVITVLPLADFDPAYQILSFQTVTRELIGAAVWVPYFLRSMRVKCTFTR